MPEAQKDLQYWRKLNDKVIQNRISKLLENIAETPFEGLGSPEPLKFQLSGKWLRRINKEHRIIYDLFENRVRIFSLRHHYTK